MPPANMHDPFSDLFWLETVFPLSERRHGIRVLRALFFSALALIGVLYGIDLLVHFSPLVPAAALFLFVSLGSVLLVDLYARSRARELSLARYWAGCVAARTEIDVSLRLLSDPFARELFVAIGVPEQAIELFCENRARSKSFAPRTLSLSAQRDIGTLIGELRDSDPAFDQFLLEQKLYREKLASGIREYLEKAENSRREEARGVFGKLYALHGVGKRWSVGVAPTLHQYEKEIPLEENASSATELARLVELFEKNPTAKVALEGDLESARIYTLSLAARLASGEVRAPFSERYPIVLDTAMLVGRTPNRAALEETLAHCAREAVSGKIFLVAIENWELYAKSCGTFGVNPRTLLAPLFSSPRVALLVSGYSGPGCERFLLPVRPNPSPFVVGEPLILSRE